MGAKGDWHLQEEINFSRFKFNEGKCRWRELSYTRTS